MAAFRVSKVFHAMIVIVMFLFVHKVLELHFKPGFLPMFISFHCNRLYLYSSSNQSYIDKIV